MLALLYTEALLVDKGLADQVWELSEAGLIPDELAANRWREFDSSVWFGRAKGVADLVVTNCAALPPNSVSLSSQKVIAAMDSNLLPVPS